MSALSDPKRVARLRAKGVPEDVIAYATGAQRGWVSPLRGVTIDGERVFTLDEFSEMREGRVDVVESPEVFRRRVAAARARVHSSVLAVAGSCSRW